MSVPTRYAIYFVPAREHPLWQAGCEWLGRDPERPAFAGSPREATEEPRRYGFHATLKPPFALRDGADPAAFLADVGRLAADSPRFAMPALAVGELAGFIALRPQPDPDELHPLRRLADRCVRELDRWRAPAREAEVQERFAGLDAERRALLRQFGYPHVLDRWRFHMTLSNRLPRTADGEALRARLLREATAHFAAALREPLQADEIAVFIEPADRAPFVLAHRCALAA